MMLDGDILYVPSSVNLLAEVLEKHKEAGCVGFDGRECSTTNRGDASNVAETVRSIDIDALICSIPEDQPIAWTQYGLFREDVIKNCSFDESGYFGKPGYGFEDNDYYRQMKELGYSSYSITGIRYYHDQSSSKRFLAKYNLPTNWQERYQQFEKKWQEIYRKKNG
jgi:GT2 family glycosyltransferase